MARIGKQDFKLLLTEGLYKTPDLSETEIYSTTDKLDDGQWYYVKNFSDQSYAIPDLPLQSSSINLILREDYEQISCIVSVQNEFYCFQNISKTQLIKKKFISFNNSVELREEQNLFIKNIPDAIYNKKNDCLYFQNLRSIVTIFDGISGLYREATTEETKAFLSNSFINLTNGFNADKVKIANRQRIALANETLKKYDGQKSNLFQYISDYVSDLNYSNNKFNISSDKDLKNLLYGIEQRFYTTPIGNEKRIAKTITKL